MPNIVHLPICPFYKYEKRKSVCCEDTYRGFKSAEDKYSWMHMYCDSWDWMRCPYAVDLNEAYERLEKGDDKALEKLERDAMKKEMKSLSTKLGRAEKKIERLQKKLDESKELVKSYQRKNEDLYRKWRSLDDKVRKEDDKIWNELGSLSEIYEQRMAYLIDTCCPDKRLYEEDVERWAGDREFTIIHDQGDSGRYWKVLFNETETKDGHEDTDIQTEEQK